MPSGPISPDIPGITILFYIVSLFSLYLLLVYFEFNRNAVVEPSNLENLGFPILATLPSVKKIDKGYHLSQIFIEDVNSEFAESVRTLRTLMVAQFKKKKTFLLTSTYSGEGKTTTTIGLVDALNHIGKKAIVCLREPSLGPCFGMKGGAAGGRFCASGTDGGNQSAFYG